MVKIPPMMGSGIQRRHAAIFGESPENIGELRKSYSKWMVLKMDGLSKTGIRLAFQKLENGWSFNNLKMNGHSKT